MRGWTEYAEVVERAQRAIDWSVETRRLTRVMVEGVRQRTMPEPLPDLPDRRFEEANELIHNLNQRLESQPVIEQAKGVLMARSHCSPDEAFEMLRRASMRMNRKLRLVAADIVTSTTAPEHRKAAGS